MSRKSFPHNVGQGRLRIYRGPFVVRAMSSSDGGGTIIGGQQAGRLNRGDGDLLEKEGHCLLALGILLPRQLQSHP